MTNGGRIGSRNVPGVDSFSGVWSVQEVADAARAGAWARYRMEVLTDKPLVYYRLDETSGAVAIDASGNANHGTYNGPTLDQSPLIQEGRAVLFDSNNNRIDGPAVNLLGDVTVEVWVRPSSVSGSASDAAYFVRHGSAGSGEANNISYAARVVNGDLRMLWQSGSQVLTEVSAGVTLDINTTYHIVMERDSVAKTVKSTVNGVVAGTVGYANNPTGGSATFLHVGYNASEPTLQTMAGVLDEVAVYDHLLGSTRVAAHYNVGIGA